MDWPAIRDRAIAKTGTISAAGRRGRAEPDEMTLIEGRVCFTGPHELAVDDDTRITADQIVLATGARPVIPASIAESGVGYHTSETVMLLDQLPASMVIVGGGGYIAAELAHLFSSLGVSIRLINQAGSLLETFDPEVSGRFTELARKRWDVRLSAEVTGVRRRGDQIPVAVVDAGELIAARRGQGCLAGWLRCSSAAMVWLSSFQLFSNLARPSRSSCPVTSSKSTPALAS